MFSTKMMILSLVPLVFLSACSSKTTPEGATSAEHVQEQQSIYTTPVTPAETAPAEEAKTPVKKSSKKKKSSRSKTKR